MTATAPAFDASIYDLPIPQVDGVKADKLAIVFSGSLPIDRTDRDGLDMVGEFKIGETRTVTVEVMCVGKPSSYQPGKDEAAGVLTHRTILRVTGIQA